MKAGQRPALSSTSRLSAGASLTIAALLGLYGTYRLVHTEPADRDVFLDIGPGAILNSDAPRDRPGRTERRTTAYNNDEKHQRYVSQIRDAEKEDKPLQLIFYGDDVTVEQYQGDCEHPGCAEGPAVFQKYFGEWRSAAFGITGDKVKELAWRVMEGGEAPSDAAPPSVAVVHVGTHDLQGSDEVPGNQTEINAVSTDIINDIWYLLNFLRQTRPRMETLVVGLLPRGPEDGTDSAVRTTIIDVNKGLTKFCEIYDGVTFVDCQKPFRLPKAKVNPALMPDLFHPNELGLKEFSNCVKKALLPLMLNVTTAKREDWVEIRPSYQVQQTKRRRRRR